jgi:SPP1 family predicted phage head-tail adaptor
MSLYTPIGALRDVVTIQRKSGTTDTQGGRSTAWADVATAWASVTPWSTQQDESIRAGAVTATGHYRVELHYRADVTPAMRVRWTPYYGDVKTLEIQAVSPKDGERSRVLLDCVEAAS